MANNGCACGKGLSSLHIGNGCDLLKIATGALISERIKADGTRNGIDISTIPLPQSVINNLLKATIGQNRWHLIKGLENTEWTQADANVQTANGGNTYFISNGVSSFTTTIMNLSPSEIANYMKLQCGVSRYQLNLITVDGKIVGYATEADVLAPNQKVYGIPIHSITVVPTLGMNDSTVPGVTITINFEKSINFSNIISIDDLAFDTSVLIEPQDAIITALSVPAITATTVRVTVVNPNNLTVSGYEAIQNLIPANFSLRNIATSATVAISSANPVIGTPGAYDLTFASTPSANLGVSLNTASNLAYVSNEDTFTTP